MAIFIKNYTQFNFACPRGPRKVMVGVLERGDYNGVDKTRARPPAVATSVVVKYNNTLRALIKKLLNS